MAELNVKCSGCKKTFTFDVGEISFPPSKDEPDFEKEVSCPNCGQLKRGEYTLTEVGQSQLTEIFLNDGIG
jgi:DNA-directed RNA polymerase subunit RPC12/RpoP